MIKNLQYRIKSWWDIWVFVIGFPIGLIFLFFFWAYLLRLSTNPVWIIVISVLFAYGAVILIVSTIIAISENNIFVSSFILLLIGVTTGILGYFYTQQSLNLDLDKLVNDFYANISTELVSIVITVLAIETLRDRIHWRNYQREKINQESLLVNVPNPTPIESIPINTSSPGQQTNLYDKRVGFIWTAIVFTIFGFLLRHFWKRSLWS